jgi:hypothetical protein
VIQNFSNFSRLNEGGAAIKSSRPIKEFEVKKTIKSIEDNLFPILGGGELNKDYLLIGSIGKKKNETDESGDIDLGISKKFLADSFSSSEDQVLDLLNSKLKLELPETLGFEPEMKLMKGINVLSIAWPIEGKIDNGTVQLDLIPISDMDWAKFIYYAPDYKKDESKYKSAHRNWLFQAILSSLKNVTRKDEEGRIMDYDSYVLRLSDGIYKNKKTYQGATKRLARPETVKGTSSEFITRDPQKTINLMFGEGVKPDDVKTFEDAWSIVSSPNFIYADKVEEIKEDLKRYLTNGGFVIPNEIQ